MDISERQKEILEYIKKSILKNGYPPSVREICEAVNLKSTSSVHSHLSILEEKGYIRRDPTKPRSIEIIDDCFQLTRREVVNVPLLGTVAAGLPLYAEENIENYYPIPAELLPNAETFILKVKGNSMVNAGILEGDQIIVEYRATAHNGDIVDALVDDSATVKRFFKEKSHYRLQPENDSMDNWIIQSRHSLTRIGKPQCFPPFISTINRTDNRGVSMLGNCGLAEDINHCPHYIRDKEGCGADHTSCGFFRESGKETKEKAEYMRKPRWFEQYYNR